VKKKTSTRNKEKKSTGNGKKRKSTTNAKRNSKLRKNKNSEQFLNTERAGVVEGEGTGVCAERTRVCGTGRDWNLR